MVTYIVLVDDCNEEDCGCYSESIDSVWLDREKAEERAKECYHARVEEYQVEQ